MALLTTAAVILGTAGLVLGANVATAIEKPPEPVSEFNDASGVPLQPVATDASGVPLQPVAQFNDQPVATDASGVPLQPQSTGRYIDPQDAQHSLAARHALEAQEAMMGPAEPISQIPEPDEPFERKNPPVMLGGAIGRPTWGVLSTNVLAPQDTTIGATVTAALGIREDPKLLNSQIFSVERELEAVNFTIYTLKNEIDRKMVKYADERTIYAKKFAESKNAETIANVFSKKLSNQGQQLNRNDPKVKEKQAEIDRAPAGSEQRKQLEREKKEMLESKSVGDEQLKTWAKEFSDATGVKIKADDERTDAEREKNKLFTQLTELRTKKDEQEKLAKDLTAKRNALLKRLQAVIDQKKKKEPLPIDMEERISRYGKAIAAMKLAEDNLRRFYTNTWIPLNGKSIQENYRTQFTTLETIWKNAKEDVNLAQAALTAPTQATTTNAEYDFAAFAADINDITRNAVTKEDIKPEFIWIGDTTPGTPDNDPQRIRGYPAAVKKLKDYALKLNLRVAANVYYEISNMDTPTLIRNIGRFTTYFDKLKGKIVKGPERDKQPKFNFKGADTTIVTLKNFVRRILGDAVNSVKKYTDPSVIPANDQQALLYSQLRYKTNEFADKQIYLLKKMFKVLDKARKEIKESALEGKNLLEFDQKIKDYYGLLDNIPPKGQCEILFKPSTFEYLSSGKFKTKDILTEVLEDPVLKDEFLDAIGFFKVSNFIEAKEFVGKQNIDPAVSLKILRTSAFAEYNRIIKEKAFNNPTEEVYYVNNANRVAEEVRREANPDRFLADDFLDRLLAYNNRDIAQITNQEYSRQIAELAQSVDVSGTDPVIGLKFVPQIFLESAELVGNVRQAVSLKPIQDFKNACETDGNVGQGTEQTNRILDILRKLSEMEISPKEELNPLLIFIKKLEAKGKINLQRPDQAQAQSALSQHGFRDGIGNWTIMKVTDDKKLNFVETFLTFRSSKFRSIPYNDTVVYQGKTKNTREVYAELALAEIQKMPSFESRKDDEKKTFPDDSDWQRLSDDFHLNFVIYRDNKGTGIADTTAASRPGAPEYNVFKAKNGRYYPIRMNDNVVTAPVIPPGADGPRIDQFNRGILGGAIDGVTFDVEAIAEEESTGKFLKRTVGQPIKQGVSAVTTKAASLGPPIKQGVSSARERVKAIVNPPVPPTEDEINPFAKDNTADEPDAEPAAAPAPAPIEDDINPFAKDNIAPVQAPERYAPPPPPPRGPGQEEPDFLPDEPVQPQAAPAAAQAPAADAAPVIPGAGTGLGQQGGRRKTTSNWRRSKPVRYTRRKF